MCRCTKFCVQIHILTSVSGGDTFKGHFKRYFTNAKLGNFTKIKNTNMTKNENTKRHTHSQAEATGLHLQRRQVIE